MFCLGETKKQKTVAKTTFQRRKKQLDSRKCHNCSHKKSEEAKTSEESNDQPQESNQLVQKPGVPKKATDTKQNT